MRYKPSDQWKDDAVFVFWFVVTLPVVAVAVAILMIFGQDDYKRTTLSQPNQYLYVAIRSTVMRGDNQICVAPTSMTARLIARALNFFEQRNAVKS